MTDPDPPNPPESAVDAAVRKPGEDTKMFHQLLSHARGLFCIVVLAVASSHLAYAQDRPDHKDALSQINTLLSGDDTALAGGSPLFLLAWNSAGSSRDFKITKLEYVNGYQKDANNYIVATTYTRVFNVSLSGIFKKSFADDPLLPAAVIWGHFESGDSFDEECKFLFLRTEKGWILQGYEGGFSVVTSHKEHQVREAIQKQKEAEAKQKEGEAYAKGNLIEVKNACASSQQLKITDNYGIGHLEDVDGKMLRDDKRYGIVPSNGQVVGCLPDVIYRNKILGYDQVPPVPMCHIQYSIGNRLVSGYFRCNLLSVVSK
jgi:hypothetical protein